MSGLESTSAWLRWALVQLRPAWAVLLLLASAAAMILITGQEQAIRLWGMVLQMLGVAAVVQELRSTSKHYGRPGIRESLRTAWLSRPRRPVTLDIQAKTISLKSQITTKVMLKSRLQATELEGRIALLEAQTKALSIAQDKYKVDLDAERKERATADAAEREAREADIRALDRRVEDVIAGTIHLSLIGVWALLLGVLLATASQELAAFHRWLACS